MKIIKKFFAITIANGSTLEWLTNPGLGEGELEFVDVGVPDKFVKLSSSAGNVASTKTYKQYKCQWYRIE